MNEEIKEILDEIKYHIEEDDYFEIEGHFLKPLLDYITNLQEENENLKDYLKIMEKGKDNNLNRFLDYKSRNEKAIKYIIDNCVLSDEWKDLDFCNFIPTGRIEYKQLNKTKIKYLLNILNGGDE